MTASRRLPGSASPPKARKACARFSTSASRPGHRDQTAAHREPRRDRAAHHPRVPRDGHRERWRFTPTRTPAHGTCAQRTSPCESVRRRRSRVTSTSTRSSMRRARTDADAIHPGYGFLSENAAFARACANRRASSSSGRRQTRSSVWDRRSRARALMERAGVPVVPGRTPADQGDAAIAAAADASGLSRYW